MRVIGILAALSATAAASPFEHGTFNDVVVGKAPKHDVAAKAPGGFATVSRLIYLNRCAGGCTVSPGFDDSRSDHSSIPHSVSHLAAFSWGDDSWNQLVQCVKDMYAPFNVTITDQDPGQAAHFELMVGGNSTDIGISGAGGVAPFVPCDGDLQDNVISFVFSAETSNLDYLCWAAAQETSHVFGLDHELLATDPMTYLSPPVKKPGFQNMAANCGESTPRTCYCGGQTQNSAQYLMDTFGPTNLMPATLAITSPADGAWVKPGFTVKATVVSQLSVLSSTLAVDGSNTSTSQTGALSFTAPTSLGGGDHVIAVNATDAAQRTFGNMITVHVPASCDANTPCAGATKCLGGLCLPDATTPGGLGATCTDNSQCITNACGQGDNQMLCTGPCDGGDSCPDGFECVSAAGGGAGVCWPSTNSGSGCATSGGGSGWLVLGMFGALGLLRRRR
jgi:MYXO-CTERM domain-containing protein